MHNDQDPVGAPPDIELHAVDASVRGSRRAVNAQVSGPAKGGEGVLPDPRGLWRVGAAMGEDAHVGIDRKLSLAGVVRARLPYRNNMFATPQPGEGPCELLHNLLACLISPYHPLLIAAGR